MDEMCRTCLRSPNKLFDIRNDDSLIEKIETIASIQLGDTITLLPTICEECITNIKKCYNFRKLIINNEKDLRDRWRVLKDEIVEEKPELDPIRVNEQSPQPLNVIKIETDMKNFPSMECFNEIEVEGVQIPPQTSPDLKLDQLNKLIKSKDLQCPECKTVFTSRTKLNNHRRTTHQPRGICNICGLAIRQDNLNRHVAMHHDEPQPCDVCGRFFKNRESLRCHKLVHRGETYTCHVCGKTSKLKSEYQRHLRTHTDPEFRKIMCTVCGKKVRDYKRHMQVHTGERPYVCTYCNKGFTSPNARKVHMRQHTNEKPYQCEYCPMAYPQKVSLVTHLKSKHGKCS